jgi:hypothetical protein
LKLQRNRNLKLEEGLGRRKKVAGVVMVIIVAEIECNSWPFIMLLYCVGTEV